MNVSPRALRLLPYRCRRIFNLKVRCRLNERDVIIPVGIDDATQNLEWSPSWRSRLFENLVDPARGVFLDIGANVGQTLLDLVLTKPGTRYVGFEPNLACVNYLRELIRANGLAHCVIVPIGLSAEARLLPLFTVPDDPTDSSATLIGDLRPARGRLDRTLVPCFPLDQVWPSLGSESVAFVKIDVEGAEFGVLRGMSATLSAHRPPVLCEVLFADESADFRATTARHEQTMELLRSLGYRVFQLIKDRFRLLDVKEVERFPAEQWSEENRHLCDYLFLTAEHEPIQLRGLIESAAERGG